MELLELLWNSFGTPLNPSIYLSIKKIYIYIIEEFQRFHKTAAEKKNKFSFTGSSRVPKIIDRSLELLELQIYQELKSLIHKVYTTSTGVPKPLELHPSSSKKLRNSKSVSEVKHGRLA